MQNTLNSPEVIASKGKQANKISNKKVLLAVPYE